MPYFIRALRKGQSMPESELYEFGYLRERDVDTLLMYSFVLDNDFLRLFTDKLDWNLNNPKITSIELSKTDPSLGESDVTVVFSSGNQNYALLIEDKIDAEAQPNQCERYYQRGDLGVDHKDYDAFAVFIVAPKRYLDTDNEASEYENKISFEEIEAYLEKRENAFDKLRLTEIQQLIAAPNKSYVSIPDESATALWLEYIDYVHTNYPELDLCVTVKHKPKGGSWIEYRTPFDRSKVKILHKTERGCLDLQFSGLANKQEELAVILSEQIGDYENQGFEIVAVGKSAALRKNFGKKAAVDYDKTFSSQSEIIKEQIEWIEKINLLAAKIDSAVIESLYSE